MFSFQIGVAATEEEEASSEESAALSEDVKAKLQEILQLLRQDISQHVQDAEPIRAILKSLRGQFSKPIEEVLIPAAFIESRQVQVLRAQKRLADRLQQEQSAKKRDDLKSLVDSTQAKIDSLTQSKVELEKTKSILEARRELLLKELEQVNQEIADVNNSLSKLPSALQWLEDEKYEQARQAYQLHRRLQPIPGSADTDQKEVQEADKSANVR